MSVRMTCNRCHSNAIIRSSTAQAVQHKKLYCICSNVACGHTFVAELRFCHTLSPSALDLTPTITEKIRHMDRFEQRALFRRLPSKEA